jgi:hypothetical protein
MKPIDPLLTRALNRAIAYCHDMYDAEMSTVKPGAPPTPEAIAWRTEATDYNRLRIKLQPKPKGPAR